MATGNNIATSLGAVCDTLAGIKAVAELLGGTHPAEVDRAAALRLIEVKAECARLWLEQLVGQGGAA